MRWVVVADGFSTGYREAGATITWEHPRPSGVHTEMERGEKMMRASEQTWRKLDAHGYNRWTVLL